MNALEADATSEGTDPQEPGQSFPIVGIGASAGGLEAVSDLLRHLSPKTGMAFVLVQHLDPTHASMLSEILARETTMPVLEVKDQMRVAPNHLYVIPPGTNMGISHGVLQLSARTEARGFHRPIDYFLRSLAEDQGHTAIAVILSGSATDGTLGCDAVKSEGGITFAQDSSARHDSMPRSAIATGSIDFVLPPAEIARDLERIGRHPYVAQGARDQAEQAARERDIHRVLELLQNATGVDFSNYKYPTLNRRITRRMVLHKVDSIHDYLRILRTNPAEADLLYQDILISVTSFFRNPDAFDALRTRVFPRLTQDRSRLDPVRVWVLGCSTGEEAYSIAMTFSEFVEAAGRQFQVQIFATDLNGACIERARTGVYPRDIVQDMSPDRLRRFFTEIDGSYRVSKPIRDMCVFAQHNALAHAPFSRIDLVSCRNLLIYLQPPAQQRLVSILHYALKPQGVLWLGASEAIGSYRELFDVEDSKNKFFSKTAGPVHTTTRFAMGGFTANPPLGAKPPRPPEMALNLAELQRDADKLVLQRFVPPAVLVTVDYEILQFRGDTSPFLAPASGRASLNLLKMVKPGLLVGVRAALQRARKDDRPSTEERLRVRVDGQYRNVNVDVIPIKGTGKDRCYLVLFTDRAPLAELVEREPSPELPVDQEAADQQIQRLTQELAATREYLQSVIEQQEAANEELQSANEEVQSANEELQSINEELETSKEEIQSSNEELATVNDELNNRNMELGQSNNDLSNLLSSVQMAIVMLGQDLRIRRFTPTAEKMLNLISADVGRAITDIKLSIDVPDLEHMLLEVIDTVTVLEREIKDRHGRWYSLRLRPYKTVDNRIEGAVIVLVDIDALKRNEETLRRQTQLLEQTHEPIMIREPGGKIHYWNRGAEQLYGYLRDQAVGKNAGQLLETEHAMGVARQQEILEREGRWAGELIHRTHDGRRIVVESRQVMLRDEAGPALVLETNRDVTDRKRFEEAQRDRIRELGEADIYRNEFLAMLAHELRNPLAPLRNALHLMQESGEARDRDLFERAWKIMDRQTVNMTRLVDDLLDAARISQGQIQLHFQPVEIEGVITRAVESARPQLEGKGQNISVTQPNEPIWIQADSVRLEQILQNLLANASKFAPQGGKIWLSAESNAGEGTLMFRVRDNGIGIEPDKLPHIFDLFMQVDRSPGREHGGLGVGLTIVKRLVELHGGTVEARSDGKDKGSEFIIRLPLSQEGSERSGKQAQAAAVPAGATSRTAPLAGPRAPKRVLVADDNLDTAESTALLLRLDGHEVRTVHSGAEALLVAEAYHPEVVLLDIGMPGLDGFAVAQRLREDGASPPPLLIAVTGFGQNRERQRAAEVGFDHYLTKPVDWNSMGGLLSSSTRDQTLKA